MAVLVYHLVINQGADYRKSIPVLDGSSPRDVEGWAVTGQIRSRPGSATLLHQLDLTIEGTSVILDIPAAASSAWTFQYGHYDVEITSPDGLTTSRLLEGVVVVRPETTR